jgi:phospho-N-acetylmuramoyl-pentapeptide-transferase
MLYLLLDVVRGWLIDHQVYWLFSVLDQLQFRALVASFLSFLVVLFFGRSTIAWLTKKKIGDTGMTDAEALRATSGAKANTPTMGGVLIVGAIVVSTFLLGDLRERYVQLGLVVVLWLAALGGIDDWLKLTSKSRGGGRQGLYPWEKLAFQLGLGLLVGFFLFTRPAPPSSLTSPDGSARDTPAPITHVLTLPFQKTYVDADRVRGVRPTEAAPTPTVPAPTHAARVAAREQEMVANPSLIYLPMAVFVLVAMLMIAGMSNAVNITDGMDGLAGGTAAAVTFGVFVLCFVSGDEDAAKFLLVPFLPGASELAVLAGATAGACLGFLWWNCSPARVFMGDTGSLSLGGIIGYCGVALRLEYVVLIMSGVFLAEILSVVMQVWYFKSTGGKRIFRCAPYHHHLHLGGWPEQQVVSRLWIVSIILVVLALASVKLR